MLFFCSEWRYRDREREELLNCGDGFRGDDLCDSGPCAHVYYGVLNHPIENPRSIGVDGNVCGYFIGDTSQLLNFALQSK